MQDAGAGYVRWMQVENLGQKPLRFKLNPTQEECAEIASRLDIIAIPSLKASGEITWKEGSRQILLTGELEAEAVQACVVSLAPVAQKIEENFTMCYTFDQSEVTLEEEEHEVSPDEEDLPELIEDGRIDVVQAVCEQIALALDPYPRAEDAESSDSATILRQSETDSETTEPEVHRPFAGLRELMDRKS